MINFAALVFFHPSGQQGIISMSSLQDIAPKIRKELFNITHPSLRVTIERAFIALKNMFKILD
jgi:hypothetical protein